SQIRAMEIRQKPELPKNKLRPRNSHEFRHVAYHNSLSIAPVPDQLLSSSR
ncbi:MAG: hypothetical protein ACI9OD_000220, partial [Limisphaerales bacterium]